MDFTARLDLLQTAGMLSEENYQIVMDTIRFFEEEAGIVLTEENSSSFVIHFCSALERIDKGEIVEEMDNIVLEGLKEEDCFPTANAMAEKIFAQYPKIPEAEKSYIITHICTLYQK